MASPVEVGLLRLLESALGLLCLVVLVLVLVVRVEEEACHSRT